MSTANTAQTTQTNAEIAATIPGIENLATQNRDELDFHEPAVWNIQRALEAACEAGRAAKQGHPLGLRFTGQTYSAFAFCLTRASRLVRRI
jgi:hypothetical protein